MAEKCIVARENWKEYLKKLSSSFDSALVKIEVAAPAVEEDVEAEWIKLNGISYDPKDDIVSIFCENLEHLAKEPTEICIHANDDNKIDRIEINTSLGQKHIVQFKEPLEAALP